MIVNRADIHRRLLGTLAVLFILMPVVSGCSVKFVSSYDEMTDRAATALQRKVERFLVKMERTAGSSAGTYANNGDFYDDARVALSGMLVRAEAMPRNELTVNSVRLIGENIENLRQLHERQGERGLTKTLIGPVRTAVNTQFTAILKLELAKKRGD